MTAELTLTSDRFETEVLQSSVPVLIDFWAPWCGPCKAIAPTIEELARDYAGRAKVFKVDVDTNPDLAEKYDVYSIPALKLFKNGQVVEEIVGNAGKAHVAAMIDRAL